MNACPTQAKQRCLAIPLWKITAVPLSNHAEPDSYCIDAHLLQVNRMRHVFEQADSSSRTERSGDPGSMDFNNLLDTG